MSIHHRFLRASIAVRSTLAVLLVAMLAPIGAVGALAQDQTTVRLAGPPSSPAETELLQQVLDDFEAANPDIQVQFEPIPDDYPVKLQTDLAAGTAADVFYVDTSYAQDLMSRDVLLPLDDYMAASGFSSDDFYPGLIQAFQWQGVTYGLPKDWSPLAMVYNEQMFEEAGVEVPTTWDELRTAAETLTEQTGQPAIVYPAEFARFITFLYQAGGGVTNPEATELTIDDPATVEALEFYYGLYRDGLAATPADVGAEWPGDALAKQLAAIVFEGNWFFPFKEANAPDLQVGIAEMPAGPGGKGSPAFTVSYSISKNTEVADAAWTLVSYLTGPEGMAKWTSLGLAMPSRPDLADLWLEEFPEREPYIAAGDYARPWQFGPGTNRFVEDANAVLQSLFADQIDVEEAKQQLVQRAQEDITLVGAGEGTPAASLAAPTTS
jgi:multiple sugar transport system substrate-binding protein